MLKKLVRLAECGLSVDQLAVACDVTQPTISVWMRSPQYKELIKESKVLSDGRVVVSLYRRACGYSHPEDKIFQHNGKPVIVPTTKYYPPETDAIRFWLTNRQPAEWRNKQATELTGADGQQIEVHINLSGPGGNDAGNKD
jgi:hypothetical protein